MKGRQTETEIRRVRFYPASFTWPAEPTVSEACMLTTKPQLFLKCTAFFPPQTSAVIITSVWGLSHLHQILVLLCVLFQAQPPQQIILSSFNELIEDVEVPLAMALVYDAWFLQQVIYDVTPYRSTLPTGTPKGRSRGDNTGFLTRMQARIMSHKHTNT